MADEPDYPRHPALTTWPLIPSWDEIIVPFLIAHPDDKSPIVEEWKRDHPDWFVAGTHPLPPPRIDPNAPPGQDDGGGGRSYAPRGPSPRDLGTYPPPPAPTMEPDAPPSDDNGWGAPLRADLDWRERSIAPIIPPRPRHLRPTAKDVGVPSPYVPVQWPDPATLSLAEFKRIAAEARKAAGMPPPVWETDDAVQDVSEVRADATPAAPSSAPAAPAPPAPAAPAVAKEPDHGAFWWWLHDRGVNQTRHEQAELLRKAFAAEDGHVFDRDGNLIDTGHMSDDELLAFEHKLREQGAVPFLPGAPASTKTSWGWDNTPAYYKALEELRTPGTHETLNGKVPTVVEAKQMIKESGGRVERLDQGHTGGRSTHDRLHINYTTESGKKATVYVRR